ncbi:unnamed protein product [Adineta ricciae]|uniref:Uncharacterized protein n=1 Tax=Adineta ricciae TaxID=249248 RepID=A0A815JHV9_ADIRI|nr:unnamed protein product [Adineta ricciae]CAF1379618.1 unnamed protein product [Adineta ricciae]
MKLSDMAMTNDDGIALDLSIVFILFLLPNLILICLTILNACILYLSKTYPQLNHCLGKLANFFANGALDRIIGNVVKRIEIQKRQHLNQILVTQPSRVNLRADPLIFKRSPSSNSSNSIVTKEYDANYLLLVPFQLDLLLTVLVYKILTRDVYFETCQTYLTTYHNRPDQVVCWLKNINRNVSNSSENTTLVQYCLNQTITLINYEHNDVICAQYVFKLINIIDTVTNIFAWHQAIVFTVTKSIVFCYWYQQHLCKFSCWLSLFKYERRIIVSAVFGLILAIYIIIFIVLLPLHFINVERQRIDLTRHLAYACSKFLVGIVVHVNIYTLYQWQTLVVQKQRKLSIQRRRYSVVNRPNAISSSIPASDQDSAVNNGHQITSM